MQYAIWHRPLGRIDPARVHDHSCSARTGRNLEIILHGITIDITNWIDSQGRLRVDCHLAIRWLNWCCHLRWRIVNNGCTQIVIWLVALIRPFFAVESPPPTKIIHIYGITKMIGEVYIKITTNATLCSNIVAPAAERVCTIGVAHPNSSSLAGTPDTCLVIAVYPGVLDVLTSQGIVREIEKCSPMLPATVVKRAGVSIAVARTAAIAVRFAHNIAGCILTECRVNPDRKVVCFQGLKPCFVE